MKAVTKRIIEDITIALSDAISGETNNQKIKKAIDNSARKLAKKISKIKTKRAGDKKESNRKAAKKSTPKISEK